MSKTAAPKPGAAKTGGAGRQGPVDPRTEDASSPGGIQRAGKTVWRRPGAATPRTANHREAGNIDAPIEFSVADPLARDAPAVKPIEPRPAPQPPTIEVLAPAPPPTQVVPATAAPASRAPAARAPAARPTPIATPTSATPTMLVPTVVTPTAFAPTALVPAELVPGQPAPTELVPVDEPVATPKPILYDEAATIDDVTQIGPVLETRPLRRPVHLRRAPKPRVRRVTRVVRHVDTWSVFKVALVFNVFFYAVALIAGVLLWQVAYATGTIDNVEKFFEGFGWETFDFNGGQIYHNAWIAGLFVAVGLTGLAVLMATLFNLITDLVGGIRLSVLEEEVQVRAERGTEQVGRDSEPPAVDEAEIFDDDDFVAQPPDQAIAG